MIPFQRERSGPIIEIGIKAEGNRESSKQPLPLSTGETVRYVLCMFVLLPQNVIFASKYTVSTDYVLQMDFLGHVQCSLNTAFTVQSGSKVLGPKRCDYSAIKLFLDLIRLVGLTFTS